VGLELLAFGAASATVFAKAVRELKGRRKEGRRKKEKKQDPRLF
jgi:hypothetical protein